MAKRNAQIAIGRKTVVIFRIGQLGDTIISLPAIRAIRRAHSDARLVLLTDQQNATTHVVSWDVLKPTGWFDEVVFYSPGARNALSSSGWFPLLRRLRNLNAETIYVLTPYRSGFQRCRDWFFFRSLAGISEIVRPQHTALNPRRFPKPLPRVMPEWRRLLEIVPDDINQESLDFKFLVPAGELDFANQLLKNDSDSAVYVAFGVGSKMSAKIWPKDNYRDLARRLLALDKRILIIVVGGDEDRALGSHLQEALGPRVRNVAGQLSIWGSAAILQRCRAYLGNDTGTMHLAAAMRIPCVAIFSARDFPGKWEPFGKNNVVLRKEVSCAGCMLEECKIEAKRCLTSITVEEVFVSLTPLLNLK